MKKRKVLLFVDNCTAHPMVRGLKSIQLAFLPLNATSCLQPCGQGFIRCIKAKYKAKMLFRLIEFIDKGAVASSVTLLDAIHLAAASWEEVTPTILENSFRKAGFLIQDDDEDEDNFDEQAVADDTSTMREAWDTLGVEGVSLDDYMTADENVVATGVPTDNDIIASVQSTDSTTANL